MASASRTRPLRHHTGRLALGLLLALGCETRPTREGAQPPEQADAPQKRPKARPGSACAEQIDDFLYAASRYQTKYVIDELHTLIEVYERGGSREPSCAEAARDAIRTVAQAWHKAFVEDEKPDFYTPARAALDTYFEHFADAPDRGLLGVWLGDVEFTRATRKAQDAVRYANHEELAPIAVEHFSRAHRAYERALVESWDAIDPAIREQASGRDVDALTRRLELLSKAARTQEGVRSWSLLDHTCPFDHRGRCLDTLATLPARVENEPLAALLAAYDRHFTALARGEPRPRISHGGPARRWLDRAELRMAHGQLDEAADELRDALADTPDAVWIARAGVLLTELELIRWLAIPDREPSRRREAAVRLSGALASARARADQLSQEDRARVDQTARALSWWLADNERELAGPQRDRARYKLAGQLYLNLYNTEQERFDRDQQIALLSSAMRSYFDAGLYGQGMKIGRQLADAYPDAPETPDTVYAVARGYERLLEFGEARGWYGRFLDQHPRHELAAEVRRRLVWIAVLLGESPDTELARLRRGTPDERRFAAAVRYRALVDREHNAEALEAYLKAFDRDHSPLRSALAHARAAQKLFKQSCPVDARAGLCVQLSREHTLGRVLPRDPRLRERAREHVAAARKRMLAKDWDHDPIAERFDAPLSIEGREIAAAEATLALIEGDLGAESALLTRPPASLDPQRVAEWFERRKRLVEEMAAAYARIEDLTSPGYAATVAARMGLIYEADSTIMLEISPSVARQGGEALAEQLDALTRTRREQARGAYNQCLARVREWGDDAEGRAPVCRAGLGRLLHRYDDPLEYLPELTETWLLGQ